jgi:uncharacterized protein YegP (UPF0339 family)
MAGTFEIVSAGQGSFRFRLKADDGTLVAVSPSFPNIKAVVAGITAVGSSTRSAALGGAGIGSSTRVAASGAGALPPPASSFPLRKRISA